jgi:hypothetical protein
MNGKIFVLQDGGKLTALSQTPYSDEDLFQSLIEKYPDILAGEQINPDNPRKWILVSREMGVPSEQDGNAQWFLDHLFIDQDAIPTFVEVKRSTDTRIRREVVAQMLDYAANAVQYWPIELIREKYESNTASDEATTLADLDIPPDSEDDFWQRVSVNLRAGRIRLIFAADQIPPSLQRIIEYLNSQMRDTEVLGLEIKQFLSEDGLKTLVPNIVGNTAVANQAKRQSSTEWDEDSFLQATVKTNGDEIAELCRKILRLFESLGCVIWWGKGQTYASFVPEYIGKRKHQLLSVYSLKSTTIEIYFQYMKPPFNTPEYRAKFKTELERIPGFHIPEARIDKRPSFPAKVLLADNAFTAFVEAIKGYINDIKISEQEDET